jgi:hypothetical protein
MFIVSSGAVGIHVRTEPLRAACAAARHFAAQVGRPSGFWYVAVTCYTGESFGWGLQMQRSHVRAPPVRNVTHAPAEKPRCRKPTASAARRLSVRHALCSCGGCGDRVLCACVRAASDKTELIVIERRDANHLRALQDETGRIRALFLRDGLRCGAFREMPLERIISRAEALAGPRAVRGLTMGRVARAAMCLFASVKLVDRGHTILGEGDLVTNVRARGAGGRTAR